MKTWRSPSGPSVMNLMKGARWARGTLEPTTALSSVGLGAIQFGAPRTYSSWPGSRIGWRSGTRADAASTNSSRPSGVGEKALGRCLLSDLERHGSSRTPEGEHEVAYLNSRRRPLCDDARGYATAGIVFNKQLASPIGRSGERVGTCRGLLG